MLNTVKWVETCVLLASKVFSQRDVYLTLFELLISAECDVNIADKLGWTPLYQAATSGETGKNTATDTSVNCN